MTRLTTAGMACATTLAAWVKGRCGLVASTTCWRIERSASGSAHKLVAIALVGHRVARQHGGECMLAQQPLDDHRRAGLDTHLQGQPGARSFLVEQAAQRVGRQRQHQRQARQQRQPCRCGQRLRAGQRRAQQLGTADHAHRRVEQRAVAVRTERAVAVDHGQVDTAVGQRRFHLAAVALVHTQRRCGWRAASSAHKALASAPASEGTRPSVTKPLGTPARARVAKVSASASRSSD